MIINKRLVENMNLCERDKCTSCGACINVCPMNCISWIVDEKGFSYPQIDNEKCIECGACQRVCHINKQTEKNYPIEAYAVWSNDPEDRKTSTSGGAASVFYQKTLENNGVCFGAAFDNDIKVVIKGYSDDRIRKFKNSKYVHSDMGNTFIEMKKLLDDNKKVTFIGLPCQISAVKAFLEKDYDNLLLIDIICHGTPPQKYLEEHIEFLENKSKKKATCVKFRNDNEFYFILKSKKDKIFANVHKDIDTYMISFFESLTYKESCYSCSYACNERVSDITIGDFWGLGIKEPFNHPYSGAISLVLLNTNKGKSFFESVKNKLFYEQRSVLEAIDGNDQLNRPSKRNENRDTFLERYVGEGFENAVNSIYGDYINEYKPIVKKYEMNKKIRGFVKKLLRR